MDRPEEHELDGWMDGDVNPVGSVGWAVRDGMGFWFLALMHVVAFAWLGFDVVVLWLVGRVSDVQLRGMDPRGKGEIHSL